MKNTILVVDDEQDVLRLLTSNLKHEGHTVLTAEDGRQAVATARREKPDVMILDLMLPSMSGLEVCRTLKSDPDMAAMPIIMLTAKHEEIDRVVGFELGADDYVAKPFSPRELVLRVQSLIRRSNGWKTPPETGQVERARQNNGILQSGPIALDFDRCEVRVLDRRVDFSPTEFKLLAVLIENPGKVLSRDKLLSEAWGYESDVETRTVDMHVLRLREKLGRMADCLETVRGFGYRLTMPARALAG